MSNKKIIIASFFLFHSFFIYLDDGSGIGRRVQAVFLFLFILIFNTRIKYIFKIRNKGVLFSLLFYVISLFITSILNKSIDTSYFLRINIPSVRNEYVSSSYTLGIMCAIVVFMHFSFVFYLNMIKKTDVLINVFFKLCLVYCIIADLFLITGVSITKADTIFSNKFALSYMHLYLVTFFCLKQTLVFQKVKYLYVFLLFAVVISIYSECTTAVIGCLVLFIVYRYRQYFLHKIFNTKIIILCLAVCALFPVFVSLIINSPIISYIVVDILGEDLTLTGRTNIYETFSYVAFLRLFSGFGLGTGGSVMMFLYGYANAQNGIVELFLEQGVLGVISVLFLLIACLKVAEQNNKKIVFPVQALVLTLIIMSTVEITIDTKFVIFLSLLLITNKICVKTNNPVLTY